jgi:hypothetical protein
LSLEAENTPMPVSFPIAPETNVGVLNVLDSLKTHGDNVCRAQTISTSVYKFEVFATAAKYLKQFFAGKMDREGRKIPREVLVTTDHLAMVLNTEMNTGFDAFYEILDQRKDLHKGEEIKYLVGVLHEARQLNIPQTLIMGIACIHAKLIGQFPPSIYAVDPALINKIDVIEKEDYDDDWVDDFENFQDPLGFKDFEDFDDFDDFGF